MTREEMLNECVSRDKAIVQLNHLKSDWDDDWNVAIRKCIETIKKLPSVTPQPKMGRWIFDEVLDHHYYCSECKAMGVDYWDYCPNCGCAMKGELE